MNDESDFGAMEVLFSEKNPSTYFLTVLVLMYLICTI